MQAANDCHSLRTGDTTQQIEHARARTGIEAGYRFVGDNERWALQQRSLSSSGHYRRSGLLRCGISIRPMSALGHKRTKRVRPNDRVCPLYPRKRTSSRLFPPPTFRECRHRGTTLAADARFGADFDPTATSARVSQLLWSLPGRKLEPIRSPV